jgi:membrane protein DedA with SNARE-associated domain
MGIEHFIQANLPIIYLIVFVGVIIEGEGVVLFSSIFAWQGLISWSWLAIAVIAGTITGDVLWYAGGKKLKGTRFGAWLNRHYEKMGGARFTEKIIERYHWYAILNKFMYFTTKPTVFLMGWHDYNAKKFLRITTYSTIIWAAAMLLAGAVFGYTIHLFGFKRIMHRIEFFAVAVFVGIFLIEWLIKKLVIKRVQRIGPTSPVQPVAEVKL